MLEQLAQLAILAWLPGAVLFRIPWFNREHRAALPAEERVFWHVVLSVTLALLVVLGLAALERYRFGYLVAAMLACAVVPAIVWRGRLRYGSGTPRPGLAALIPIALVMLCGTRFLPPSEYVIGGKDPGTYVNEGVQIAQRGTLLIHDPLVAEVPGAFRDLFFPSHQRSDYYGQRFMGFFIQDPDAGTVVGQFSHLFPAALAIGYGVDGLTGVRRTTPFLATLGVLAVYFTAAALFGRAAGAGAAFLLALNVIQVWFGRYPNAEVLMQALVLASVLALVRSRDDEDPFFAAIAGGLLGVLMFLRYDTVLAIGAITGGAIIGRFARWKVHPAFFVALAIPVAAAIPYLAGPMRAYVAYPIAFARNMPFWQHAVLVLGATAILAAIGVASRTERVRAALYRWTPLVVAAIVAVAALYGLFLRHPGGRLAEADAYALRTFANSYVTVPALLAAVLGYAIYARAAFWRAPHVYVLTGVFALFFFYKLRIVHEYFWAARRFVPVVLPATLMFASAAALGGRSLLRRALGTIFLLLVAAQYWMASAPLMDHVEFAGVIPRLEALAAQFGDDDLVLVESRDAGVDTHVVALPLAYIYARHVLVLNSARPDRDTFAAFVDWARTKYARVFFVGGGGSDLVSSTVDAHRTWRDRFEVPEYQSVVNGYPRGPRNRKFDHTVYELVPSTTGPQPDLLVVDVGGDDDLQVVRFQAKEDVDGRTVRWTAARSIVTFESLPAQAQHLELVASDGGRPEAAPPARVDVWFGETRIGSIEVDGPFQPYQVAIPPALAAQLSAAGHPLEVRLESTLWIPAAVLGSGDDRELGVMLDRVTIR